MPRPLIPQRRRRILDAAEELVLDRGFNAMSVSAVTERAGIAKGAFYREFAAKDEVLDALLRRSMDRMTAAAADRLGHDPRPPLSLAYRVGVEVLLAEPLMVAAFLDDEGVLGTYIDSVDDHRYRQRYLDVEQWIVELQRSGRLDAGVDAGGLALALSSATLGLLAASRHLGPLTEDQLAGALTAIDQMVARLEPRR